MLWFPGLGSYACLACDHELIAEARKAGLL
jgi:hypothetical protein